MKGLNKHRYPLYLYEFMWCHNIKITVFLELLKLILCILYLWNTSYQISYTDGLHTEAYDYIRGCSANTSEETIMAQARLVTNNLEKKFSFKITNSICLQVNTNVSFWYTKHYVRMSMQVTRTVHKMFLSHDHNLRLHLVMHEFNLVYLNCQSCIKLVPNQMQVVHKMFLSHDHNLRLHQVK